MPSTLPVDVSDDVISRYLSDAHLPSLIAALVHVTGDEALVRGGIKPVYDFFGDGQGGLTDDQKQIVHDDAIRALARLREGALIPPPPSLGTIRHTMNFVAGGDIPERYVPFLLEELALEGEDRIADKGEDIPAPVKNNFHALIIGAGMSGLLAAIRLDQAGIPYTIVDKNADVGGTWLENSYPGCRVDNPNHMYCYSFEPNYDWPHHYSTQDALLAYFRRVADKYGIRSKVRFNTEVVESVYDEKRAVWTAHVRDRDGHNSSIDANVIVSAVGQLNRPKLPDIKGVGTFKGPAFHSARWDHSVDLKGKRVIVIGTGASAFQFVPAIAQDVAEMFVFQRTPPWLGPTPNYHDAVGEGQKWLLKHVPYYAQWYRFWLIWMLTDGLYPMVQADPAWNGPLHSVSMMNEQARGMLTALIQQQAGDDADLFRKVIPDYPLGGKRSVRDNGVWISALKRDNVHLITEPIVEITGDGVKTRDGKEYAADILIYGTGFTASKFLSPMKFKGRGGKDLHEQWQGDARAYLGITIPGFPNLFLMYGPNTNIVVNGSIIFFSECEMRYILGAIEMMLRNGHAAIEPRRDVHDAFNEKVDAGNAGMAWGVPQVTSWYKNDKGRVSQNWPFPIVDYWYATLKPNPADFETSPRLAAE
ncbi:MAG: NAD(P)/FAD-dependent oxidoreductase [Rhizomicrobium sp.]|jgi:4-hydroxyacetophenone monooxygenase